MHALMIRLGFVDVLVALRCIGCFLIFKLTSLTMPYTSRIILETTDRSRVLAVVSKTETSTWLDG